MTVIPCEFVELPKEKEAETTMEWPHVFAKLPFDHNIFLERSKRITVMRFTEIMWKN